MTLRIPTFVDQPRIQNLPEYLETHASVEFEITEKLEGSSITVFYHKSRFGICSRNFELKLDDNTESVAVKVVSELGVKNVLESFGKNIALQGELIGPGIQGMHPIHVFLHVGNIYKLPTHDWKIFDIWLIDELRYATPDERHEILKQLKLHDRHVPGILKVLQINLSH